MDDTTRLQRLSLAPALFIVAAVLGWLSPDALRFRFTKPATRL